MLVPPSRWRQFVRWIGWTRFRCTASAAASRKPLLARRRRRAPGRPGPRRRARLSLFNGAQSPQVALRRLMYEQCEPRQLMTVTSGIETIGTEQVLHIRGDDAANVIIPILVNNGAELQVSSGNSYPLVDFVRILVDSGNGDDVVTMPPGLNKPVTIDGGAGNDNLAGGIGRNNLIGGDGDDVLNVNNQLQAKVVGRLLFYADSPRYDVTNSRFPGFEDDNAIAKDKSALLPGGTATFANISSYAKGVNGVMIDLIGAAGVSSITASDFSFKMGNDNMPGQWVAAPSPASVVVRAGAGVGGSDRVELIWTTTAVRNAWLQVTVAATANTGLWNPDVFYFGSAVGYSGVAESQNFAVVTGVDESMARINSGFLFNNIPITNRYDYDRNGSVSGSDESIARLNSTNPANATKYVKLPPLYRDTIVGGAGNDTLIVAGTGANDSIDLSIEGVTVNGQVVSYSDAESLVLRGGTGNDAYKVVCPDTGSLPATVTVNDTWGVGIDNSLLIEGSAHDDVMTLTDSTVTVNDTTILHTGVSRLGVAAGDGNDTITNASSLNADLSGGAGNDTFNIDTGSYSGTLRGDAGQNTYAIRGYAQGNYTIDQAGGQADTLSFADWHRCAVSVNLLQNNVQTVGLGMTMTLAGASDSITTVIGTSLDDTITANNLGNLLLGGDGNDTLSGGDGLDTIMTCLGDETPSSYDVVCDTPAATGGLHQVLARQIFLGNPEEFALDNSSAPGLKYSFALTEEGLGSYQTAGSSDKQPLTFQSPGTQTVWGRVFQSATVYTTYRTDVTVEQGYGLSGDLEVVAASGPYSLKLISTDNTSAAAYTDWLIDWGDGSTPQAVHVNPTLTEPVFITHYYPEQTGTRTISATVADGGPEPTPVGPLEVRVTDGQPFPPENLRAMPNGSIVTISWDHPSGPEPSRYTIFASDNGLDDWTVWWGPFSVAEPTSVGRPATEKKFFKMVATNDVGDSLDSQVVTAPYTAEDLVVQVSAQVQTSPALATVLNWPLDIQATGYNIYRRLVGSTGWGAAIGTRAGNSTGFIDHDVFDGLAYEYKIVQDQNFTLAQDSIATGFISVGINVPLVESRGTTVLIVDNTFSVSLADEIARLQEDLVGDGWNVIRRDILRTASVSDVKALIKSVYDDDPDQVKQVLLLGHLAVPYSGYVNVDGHSDHLGAWPADVYYGDMNGAWNDTMYRGVSRTARQQNNVGDGKFDPNDLSDGRAPELAVGRIDMWGMPLVGPDWLDEAGLLRRYLDRDHAYRHGTIEVAQRALVDSDFANYAGGSGAAAFGNYVALVGDANVEIGDYLTEAAKSAGYLWGYGDGGGHFDSAHGIGTTTDFMSNESNVVFSILFGSYFGDWDVPNNFLRAPLAGQGLGLTTAFGNWGTFTPDGTEPQWSYHRMGLGGTIGESTAYSQNGGPGFQPSDIGIWWALMGDPSLRMHVVKPPSDVAATRLGDAVEVTWLASPESTAIGFQGYNIYRSTPTGGFIKLNASPQTDLAFTDTTALAGNYTYMVRAIKLESGSSGTYYNASQGAFDNMGAATALGIDAVTQGDWKTAYGCRWLRHRRRFGRRSKLRHCVHHRRNDPGLGVAQRGRPWPSVRRQLRAARRGVARSAQPHHRRGIQRRPGPSGLIVCARLGRCGQSPAGASFRRPERIFAADHGPERFFGRQVPQAAACGPRTDQGHEPHHVGCRAQWNLLRSMSCRRGASYKSQSACYSVAVFPGD